MGRVCGLDGCDESLEGCMATRRYCTRAHALAAWRFKQPQNPRGPGRPRTLTIRNGDRFGRLVVMRNAGPRRGERAYRCECDCGRQLTVVIHSLCSGNTKSCGCHRREVGIRLGSASATHRHTVGGAPSRTYVTWRAMRYRCVGRNAPNYALYGGRGITVCERWQTFENFLEDMGERPEGRTIDRIDNDGNYEPGNCRWATPAEQRHNQRPRRI